IRAGAKGGEIYASAGEALGRASRANSIEVVAHGMGLVSHEAPRLTSHGPIRYPAYDADRPLEQGMVISIETTIAHPRRGFVKLEDAIAGGDGIEAAAAPNSSARSRHGRLDGVLRRSDNGQAPGVAMNKASRAVLVWDAPIRLFHWLVAALVAAAYATWRLNWMTWHGWIGEAL